MQKFLDRGALLLVALVALSVILRILLNDNNQSPASQTTIRITVPPQPTNTPNTHALPSLIATDTHVPIATNTDVPTATNTDVPTATDTHVPIATDTHVPTVTNTHVPTATNTDVPTAIPTLIPTTVPSAIRNYPESICPSAVVNLRKGAGHTRFERDGQIRPGNSYQVVGAVEGESVSGNTVWYLIEHNGRTSYVTAHYAQPCNLQAQAPSGGGTALVTNIVDGDTIDVRLNGQEVRVRYIGVDTPERGEACYAEATSYNRRLVSNKTVRLVKDVSETDRYGRLLRYVWVGDTFVNLALVQAGYAEAKYYAPDGRHYNKFVAAQRTAVRRGCVGAAARPRVPTARPRVQVAQPQSQYDTTSSCATLREQGSVPAGGWPQGHPMHTSRRDGDKDGWACE